MTIEKTQTLFDLASTSLATYATMRQGEHLTEDLQNTETGADFTEIEAGEFARKYNILNQKPNIDLNGFSASVFQDKSTGEKILAIRGTEFNLSNGEVVNDFLNADIFGIGATGYANFQAAELYRYFKQLTTAGGEPVIYSEEELFQVYILRLGPALSIAALASGSASPDFINFKNELLSDRGIDAGIPGQSVIDPGEKINITGHSLGGHLAMLFGRLFPNNVNEIVTLNAPTFFSHGDLYLSSEVRHLRACFLCTASEDGM